MARRVRLQPLVAKVVAEPLVTLRPRGGMPVAVELR
jgi:hypothetical protein